jgi:hypothetical protein
MAPHDEILTPIFKLIKGLQSQIRDLEARVVELEQINDDRINDKKMKRFFEDKLGL